MAQPTNEVPWVYKKITRLNLIFKPRNRVS
jgi:hypothetical protein